jgi:hypothetical protein
MKNDIFRNPRGWGAKAVGSSVRYRLMQFYTLLLGALLGIMLYLVCREGKVPLLPYIGILLFLLIAVVELPLLYLRALRAYVLEHQSSNHEIC